MVAVPSSTWLYKNTANKYGKGVIITQKILIFTWTNYIFLLCIASITNI